MAGSSPFTVIDLTNILSPNSANSVKAFRENSNENQFDWEIV